MGNFETSDNEPDNIQENKKTNITALNEKEFKIWNATTPSFHRNTVHFLSSATQQVMCSRLHNMHMYLKRMKCDETVISSIRNNAFTYSSAKDFNKVKFDIFTDIHFDSNSRKLDHNYLRSAILRYQQFLKWREENS